MKDEFRCEDLQEVMREEHSPRLIAAIAHAESCDSCKEELSAWSEISRLSPGLHVAWDSPELWPRIMESVKEEAESFQRVGKRGVASFRGARQSLLAAAAVLAIVAIGVMSFWAIRISSRSPWDEWTLEESALQEVERAEQSHLRSIERLEALVAPGLDSSSSPLVLNYRDKLMLLDDAIAECEEQIRINRSNTHLRRELLSLYTDKQGTLQQLLNEERHEGPTRQNQ